MPFQIGVYPYKIRSRGVRNRDVSFLVFHLNNLLSKLTYNQFAETPRCWKKINGYGGLNNSQYFYFYFSFSQEQEKTKRNENETGIHGFTRIIILLDFITHPGILTNQLHVSFDTKLFRWETNKIKSYFFCSSQKNFKRFRTPLIRRLYSTIRCTVSFIFYKGRPNHYNIVYYPRIN